jgi:hypothetical protein
MRSSSIWSAMVVSRDLLAKLMPVSVTAANSLESMKGVDSLGNACRDSAILPLLIQNRSSIRDSKSSSKSEVCYSW